MSDIDPIVWLMKRIDQLENIQELNLRHMSETSLKCMELQQKVADLQEKIVNLSHQ